MGEHGEEGHDEQGANAKWQRVRPSRSQTVEQPQDRDDRRGEHGPGEDAVERAAVEFDPVDRESERREDIDVRRVGAEQAGGEGEARPALQPHLAEQRAGKRVGDIVQSACHEFGEARARECNIARLPDMLLWVI